VASISVCMVVKDEAHSLERSLTSILPAVQEVILVDTGSSDETLQIAGRFSVKVSRFPWRDDFSAARNFSLDLATLPWILVLDADEVFSTVDRIALTTLLKHSEASAYSLTQRNYVESSGKLTWATDDFVEKKQAMLFPPKDGLSETDALVI
jgi:glycosyltransferase involved in cell wall biosynthesis